MAQFCSLFNINNSPRTPYSPWTNGLVEIRNNNLGTHLRLFFKSSFQLVGHFQLKCIELLKSLVVVSFSSVSTDIRSLRF